MIPVRLLKNPLCCFDADRSNPGAADKVLNQRADSIHSKSVDFPATAQNKFINCLPVVAARKLFESAAARYANK
jgi:DNA-binding FadR family transcriptional regulator